jgi:hypothetical protein
MHAQPDCNDQSVTFTGGMHMPPDPWSRPHFALGKTVVVSYGRGKCPYYGSYEISDLWLLLLGLLLLQLERGHARSLREQIWP